MSQENVEIVRRAFEYEISGRGSAEVLASFDPDVVMKPIEEGASFGVDAIRDNFQHWQSAWEALEVTIEEIIDAGDRVVWRRTTGGAAEEAGSTSMPATTRSTHCLRARSFELMNTQSAPRPSKPPACGSRTPAPNVVDCPSAGKRHKPRASESGLPSGHRESGRRSAARGLQSLVLPLPRDGGSARYRAEMALDLFAGIPVSDYEAAKPCYERLLGGEPSFIPHATEAVWDLAEHRFLFDRFERDTAWAISRRDLERRENS